MGGGVHLQLLPITNVYLDYLTIVYSWILGFDGKKIDFSRQQTVQSISSEVFDMFQSKIENYLTNYETKVFSL